MYVHMNHSSPPTASATLTLRELSNELSSVQDWHSLGIQLGLNDHELRTIEKDHPGESRRWKHEMLEKWLQNSKLPTWKAVIDALHLMGELAVASKIQTNHCSSSTATGMHLLV